MAAALAMTGAPRFEEIYEATFAVVWRTLARLGVPPAGLDDAAQEVFLIVHRRRGEFEGRSSLKTWVVGIAIRVAADHRRSVARRPQGAPLMGSLPDRAPSPHEHAAMKQERALVHRLLAELPDEQREVFVLTELEQLTAPEISEAVGANLNTVYSRLRLARRGFDAALARFKSAGAAHE